MSKTPTLELYTSPPILFHGKTIRVQVLAPPGWRTEVTTLTMIGTGVVHPYFNLRPIEKGEWLPEKLRRFVYGPNDHRSGLDIIVGLHGNPEFLKARKERIYRKPLNSEEGASIASILVKSGLGYSINYVNFDVEEFESTYREIIDSLKETQ